MVEIGELSQTAVTLAGGTGGLVALALYLRRMFKSMGLEERQQQSAMGGAVAIDAVLATMRQEVERLAMMNRTLSLEIGDLQTTLIAMQRENVLLKAEVEKLQAEIQKLTRQGMEKCYSCPLNRRGRDPYVEDAETPE